MRIVSCFVVCLAIAVALPGVPEATLDASGRTEPRPRSRTSIDHGRLPVAFEANYGQADPAVRFLARGAGYGVYLTRSEAVLVLGTHSRSDRDANRSTSLRVRPAGANPRPAISGVSPLAATSNYFVGDDPARWRTGVPNFAGVKYANVYPGIDLVYYGRSRQLEYDFVVAPGADPRRIVVEFEGVTGLSVDAAGDLVLATPAGQVVQRKPVVYQEVDGERKVLDGRYRLRGKRRVGFDVARHDRTRPLVIDPTLVYATHLGGATIDVGYGIAVDRDGNAYVTGETTGGFPTTRGAAQVRYGGDADAFVAKFDPTGTALVYSTYIGGSGADFGHAIAVDSDGNAYVTGYTSGGFPATPGAVRCVPGGGSDVFVAKLNATGTALLYAACLGGPESDIGNAIAVDGGGNAHVTGVTQGGFPTTPGSLQTTYPGFEQAFVAKLNATGTALSYSTYLGSRVGTSVGTGIAVDGGGNAYVTGSAGAGFATTAGAWQPTFGGGGGDAFVTKLNAAGNALVYSTYLGGTGDEAALAIALDGARNAYVAGVTSGGFPVTPAAYQTAFGGYVDAFVAKLDASGSALVYATYLGGPADDVAYGIAVDARGNAFVTGRTYGDFPTTADAWQPARGGRIDAFVAALDRRGRLGYATYLGGAEDDWGSAISVDVAGNLYVTGYTNGLPTTDGSYQPGFAGMDDSFVARFSTIFPVPLTAVEYYHAAFDHYFVTTLPLEIAVLDAGAVPGWVRTGQSFLAYPLGAPDTNRVCRFWSGRTFAPKSSHFYTPFDSECAQLRYGRVWVYEGEVFSLGIPGLIGACALETGPLYRLYNDGQGGAPNHRYTTSFDTRSEMIAKGWVPEGYGGLGVIGCVPEP